MGAFFIGCRSLLGRWSTQCLCDVTEWALFLGSVWPGQDGLLSPLNTSIVAAAHLYEKHRSSSSGTYIFPLPFISNPVHPGQSQWISPTSSSLPSSEYLLSQITHDTHLHLLHSACTLFFCLLLDGWLQAFKLFSAPCSCPCLCLIHTHYSVIFCWFSFLSLQILPPPLNGLIHLY